MIAPDPARDRPESEPPTPKALRLRGAREFAQALAEGCTVTDAAKRAGIHRRTGHARLQDADLRRYVAQLRAESFDAAQGRLTSGLTAAADALVELLEHENAFAKLQAARAVFETALRMREVLDLEERLQAIEERLRAQEESKEFPTTGRRW